MSDLEVGGAMNICTILISYALALSLHISSVCPTVMLCTSGECVKLFWF
jgi:hypothetical protein